MKVDGHERKMHKILKEETHVVGGGAGQDDDDAAMYERDDGVSGSDFYSYVLIPIQTGDLKL
jgi:hypothetical protein